MYYATVTKHNAHIVNRVEVNRVETYLFHGRDRRRVLSVIYKRETLPIFMLEWSEIIGIYVTTSILHTL